MGCIASKQHLCRNRKSPVPRCYSMNVHHPPVREGDSYHVVALTSTTLGSLELDSVNPTRHFNEFEPLIQNHDDSDDQCNNSNKCNEFSIDSINKAKIVPEIRTPPSEPETINTWELMEGLEDNSSSRLLHENGDNDTSNYDSITNPSSKASSIICEFDPDVISTFRKAFDEFRPASPVKQALAGKDESLGGLELDGKNVRANKCPTRGKKKKVVLYFTSLRGVRRTYEDCCHVRVILKGLGVRVDERDVSMHSGFKDELKGLLGKGFNHGGLPRLFVGEEYVGGAEEVRRMNEEGQLEKVLEGCEVVDNGGGGGGGGGGGVCKVCGDIRFVPCETCCGSCKVYHEGDFDEEFDESECGFQRCPDCNENGIIRCPICCD